MPSRVTRRLRRSPAARHLHGPDLLEGWLELRERHDGLVGGHATRALIGHGLLQVAQDFLRVGIALEQARRFGEVLLSAHTPPRRTAACCDSG
jgi:hypothetical protein